MKPENYTKARKLICEWTVDKNYSTYYRMLKIYVRHGLIVDKIHEIISCKQNKCWEKNITFNTQK